MTVDRLLSRRLLFVAGKGGVGRTTVAAVLGLSAAGRGLRTIVAGVGGRDELPGLFGADPKPSGGGGERELIPGLSSIAIDPQAAMEEYLRDQLPIGPVADLLSSSRTFGYLAAATPGLRELLTVGKVWELAQPARRVAGGEPYDLVVVDGPATGYGVGLLAAPRTFANVARRGPISRHAATIHASLVDRRMTGVVGVSRPDEAAVNELLETGVRLRGELGIELCGVIVNGVGRRRFAGRDRSRLRAALADDPEPAVGRALRLAVESDERERIERAEVGRLAEGVGEDPIVLPFVIEGVDRDGLIALSELLEAGGSAGLRPRGDRR
jgi:anion-transporting  ArsA/GET3 family ATPase